MDSSIIELELARDLHSSPVVYYGLADAYIQLGDYNSAEKQYKFLTYAIPNLLRPHFFLARLYYLSGQREKWRKEALKVLSFNSKVKTDISIQMKDEIRTLLSEDLKK